MGAGFCFSLARSWKGGGNEHSQTLHSIAAAIFALMMLAHVYRLATDFQIVVGSHSLPMSVSWIAIVITAILAVMLYRESQR